MADRAAWERGLIEKRWQGRLVNVRAIAEEAAASQHPEEAALGQRLLEALDGIESPSMVAVSRADLDLAVNHAGDPQRVVAYSVAVQRLRGAIEGTIRG